MKILAILILFIGMSINFTAFCGAPDNPPDEYDVPLVPGPGGSDNGSKDDPPPIELPPDRHRTPGMALHCTISHESGITISGSGIADDIVSYEVCDTTGACIAIFSDEQSFIDFIFSGISGEYLLRFRTPEYSYSGIISIK